MQFFIILIKEDMQKRNHLIGLLYGLLQLIV